MGLASISARLRLGGGMILMIYVLSHLANLSLGVWSLDAMERARGVIMAPWESPVGQLLLYSALASHGVLGLVSLAQRRNVSSLQLGDVVQLVLGLLIPPLLALHLLASRGAALLDHFEASYGWFLSMYWKQSPWRGLGQVLVIAAAWIHGCLGLHVWLRLRPWWPRFAGLVYPAVFLVPILALLGFVEAGKEAIFRLDGGDPAWAAGIAADSARFAALAPRLTRIQHDFLAAYAAAIGAALFAAWWRWRRSQRQRTEIEYLDGPTVRVPCGLSILEASRAKGVPHAGACGGHGRCSTCRVQIFEGAENLSPPQDSERALLARLGLASEIRLACQAHLAGPRVRLRRLIAAEHEEEAARAALGMASSAAAGAR